MSLFKYLKNYITITMLTSTPWSLLFFLRKLFIYLFFEQTNPMSLTTMGYSLPFFKGATAFFKLIYNCCCQQWGVFLSFFIKGVMTF
jgi:hypothetical protein